MTISETPKDFLTQRQRPDIMTTSQLQDYLWKLSKSGAKSVIKRIKVELYQRFALPFTNIVIILLGIPFALKMQKRATGIASLGISIIMGFLYYVLNAVSIALGMAGKLPPFLAAFLSHIIAFSFSIYMISKLP
jgi:lipopolysaccharide export system permease protein